MANIAAGDLVYSFDIKDKQFLGRKGYAVRGSITFGDNSITYGGGGGLPLTKGKMGLPRFIRSLQVIGSSTDKYRYDYVPSTEKLKLGVPAGTVSAPTISLANAGANAAANAAIFSDSGVLSHGIAAATGITGVQAPTFSGTGSAELGNVAITTTTIQILAEGY